MDDMSKYMSALSESAAGTAKVDSMNAALVDSTSAFNAKLRNIHSEVMGGTDPVGIALVAKGVTKVGTKVVSRVATKSLQNINEQMTAITDKGAARLAGKGAPAEEPIDETGLTADESSQLDSLVSQSKLAAKFTSSTESAITPNEPAESAVTDGVETGSKSVAAAPPKPLEEGGAAADDTSTAAAGAADDASTAAAGAAGDASTAAAGAGAADASTEATLASSTAASAADDWNPIGIVATIGLGLATLFAGIFGHHKEQVARHVQTMTLNPSTQFGV